MSALHDALRSLSPIEYSDTPLDNLSSFLATAFSNGQTIVDSIPIPEPSDNSSLNRSRASSTASCSSEIVPSPARSAPPSEDIQALQKEWKSVKVNAKENPLGMNVYKMSGKGGKGTWFARRSVHEGLGFKKWKRALEREFPEAVKVEGGPGTGAVRGIGGEKRVAFKCLEGVGKMEVYLLSAQFPGPTTPRDFVTMFLTCDQVITGNDSPRHFMVISRPCNHPDAPPRSGYIRGQYESVEFIREIPLNKYSQRSASTTNLPAQGKKTRSRSQSSLGREAILRNANLHHPNGDSQEKSLEGGLSRSESGRARGKTLSFDTSRGSDAKGENIDVPRDDEESEDNPVEWIMMTRSDPGGSVPRFMIDRGTPGGICADAAKFLDWACAKDIEDLQSDDEEENLADDIPSTSNGIEKAESTKEHKPKHRPKELHNPQTNGHLAGIVEQPTPGEEVPPTETTNGGGLYGIVAGVGGYIASHTPTMISDYLPGYIIPESPALNGTTRRSSISSTTSSVSTTSFASALERTASATPSHPYDHSPSNSADTSSIHTTSSATMNSLNQKQDKQLQKLTEKKDKLTTKLEKAKESEMAKKSSDEAALAKVKEKHDREIKKQEERYKKEIEKIEKKKERERRKVEERRKREEGKQLELVVEGLRRENEMLRGQVGDLQGLNTRLVRAVGGMGSIGDEVLKACGLEVKINGAASDGGRERAMSKASKGSGNSGGNGRERSSAGSSRKEKESEKENQEVVLKE